MNVLLTGATGFVGSNLLYGLKQRGHVITSVIRNRGSAKEKFNSSAKPLSKSFLIVDSLGDITPSNLIKRNVKTIVHCAGLAHAHNAKAESYTKINTDLTLQLARIAIQAGVRRFIFFSSIGVNGPFSCRKFSASDSAKPYNAYTKSKLKAELALIEVSKNTNMEVVIIRPPLIYGRNAPGNFSSFVKLAKLPIPKPLGAINNMRSFVSVDNLVDFTNVCLSHPAAANQIFLVSDGCDISTSDFLRKVSKALGKKSWLFPFPVFLLKSAAKIFGMQIIVDKLTSNLRVDIEKNKKLLGWEPPVSVDSALQRALG